MYGLVGTGCVVHVGVDHPLSGDHVCKEQVGAYLAQFARIGGGSGGWEVHTITTDDSWHGVALLVGTIRDFSRDVVHIWHVQEGRVTEFWDAYRDGHAENEFWTAALAE